MTDVQARPGANAYGYFDEAAREYVITRPDTPTPWLNYIGEGRYGGIVSNTGGGFSFDRDPRNRRVSRYRYNSIPVDQPGRYVYLRDQETGEYWSPTARPTRVELDAYECRHGTAYTRISGALKGIAAEILYFVPLSPIDEPVPCELWVLKVRNDGSTPRRLRSFSYVEFSLPDANSDLYNMDWAQHIVFSSCENGVIRVGTKFNPLTYFFASSGVPAGYTCDREDFVGRGRDLTDPIVVETGTPSNAPSPRGNSIGSLTHDIELAPGEEREIIFVMGATERPAEIGRVVARYSQPGEVIAAFQALRDDWDRYLSRFTVETPDADTNAMINFWNQVQCRTTLYWSRFVSGYETGLGRGMGTRDSGQDTLGTMHTVPDHARRMLTTIWTMQFADGHTWHQFYPLTLEGGPGLAGEYPEWPQWFSDDHLWLIIAVCAYLRETGDFDYLEQKVPYVDHAEETVWEHMRRALDFTLNHLGPHGLPRSGFSDWNDTLDVDHGSGKAESVWTAMQFCKAILDLAELCEKIDRPADARHLAALHATMAAAVNEHAWDGAWYMRSFDDDGLPIGIHGAAHHAIDLIPQSWSVLGEVASPERAEQAMASADEKLNTKYGIALMWPPYDGADPRVAGMATYVPGAKENGGIFCHANTWSIVAAAMLGQGDQAYKYYRQILPLARTDSDLYKVEPYTYPQNICGPAHPSFGMARNAWLTGTASWTFVAATQWILGIRPTYEGLRVAPAMPAGWSGFKAHREFRGTAYEIVVRREGPGNVAALSVDGARISGDVVPLPAPGTPAVRVEVVLT
ncbi:MAG: glycosyl transferase family 36 [Candidatus Limnocylindrales bacterium]|jgi:cellobiose phosphorylase